MTESRRWLTKDLAAAGIGGIQCEVVNENVELKEVSTGCPPLLHCKLCRKLVKVCQGNLARNAGNLACAFAIISLIDPIIDGPTGDRDGKCFILSHHCEWDGRPWPPHMQSPSTNVEHTEDAR